MKLLTIAALFVAFSSTAMADDIATALSGDVACNYENTVTGQDGRTYVSCSPVHDAGEYVGDVVGNALYIPVETLNGMANGAQAGMTECKSAGPLALACAGVGAGVGGAVGVIKGGLNTLGSIFGL